MADGTPGIGRMAAVVGAMSALGLIASGGVQAEPSPPPSPHVLTAQDLLDRQQRQLGEDGEPLAFGGGSRGILQPSSTEASAHGATLLDPLTD